MMNDKYSFGEVGNLIFNMALIHQRIDEAIKSDQHTYDDNVSYFLDLLDLPKQEKKRILKAYSVTRDLVKANEKFVL